MFFRHRLRTDFFQAAAKKRSGNCQERWFNRCNPLNLHHCSRPCDAEWLCYVPQRLPKVIRSVMLMKSNKYIRLTNALLFLAVTTLTAAVADVSGKLQTLIDQAPEKGEVIVPRGIWKEPLVISKPLKLRGASAEGSVLEITADEPALRVTGKGSVELESLTIRWQRATSERAVETHAALWVRDAPLTIRAVRFQAPAGNARSPVAMHAMGFCAVKVEQCDIEGYEFPVQFSDGAQGTLSDCVIWKPGHAGITVGPDCSVEVVRCLIAGSAYHGIRCTGGKLTATDNLVIGNKNRGFYLGNKSAQGVIRNNVILDNGTGISGFSQSEVEVVNNLIAKSDFAALDARDTCRLRVHRNVFLDNTRALVLFKESGKNRNVVQENLHWGNKTDAENFEPTPAFVRSDPQLKDIANGDFAPADANLHKGHGLQDATVMKALWVKWTALLRNTRP